MSWQWNADVLAHYDRRAQDMLRDHRKVVFSQVHRTLMRYLPIPPGPILDIGAGAGRDASALAAMGYEVVAVEPSAALREGARLADSSPRIRWVEDDLPRLVGVRSWQLRFDLVLCSAVLMHLDSGRLAESMASMAQLLTSTGRIALTLRAPVPGDPNGLYHDHRPSDIAVAAAGAGLSIVGHWRELDVLRGDRWWDGFVLAVS